MTLVGSMPCGMPPITILLDEADLRETAHRFLMMADDQHEVLEHKGESNGEV
jgi:hypothetical protein